MHHLATDELQRRHRKVITDVLTKFIRNTTGVDCGEILDDANSIAKAIQAFSALGNLSEFTDLVDRESSHINWFDEAISHSSGSLALYWIHSIELWYQQAEPTPSALNAEYRCALDSIMGDEGITGKLGRTILASQFRFFFTIDEQWALNNLLPLFSVCCDDFQCAWGGYLTWGLITPATANHLRAKFIEALPRVFQEFDEHTLRRFISYYFAMMSRLISSAYDEWISEFFKYANLKAKILFASEINQRLSKLNETSQQEWWKVWLKDYWENRLSGVPKPLDSAETVEMLTWALHLPSVFTEAVTLATQMDPVSLNHSLMLLNVGESGLADRYPDAFAELLVHLGKCETDQWFWSDAKDVIVSLLERELPPVLGKALCELKVRKFK